MLDIEDFMNTFAFFFQLDNNLFLPCFYMCSYIVFIQMPTWDRWYWTSNSLTIRINCTIGIDIVAWQLVWLSFKETGEITALLLLSPDLHEWEWRPRIWVMMIMMMDDDNAKINMVYLFPSGVMRLSDVCMDWCKTRGEKLKLDLFQLFRVCSFILSVNSAFQRPVLGMSMRKMTMNYKWWLMMNSICLLLFLNTSRVIYVQL